MRHHALSALLAASTALTCVAPAQAQSLDVVVEATLARSPDLAAARARADGASARVDQARAERMPSASVQGEVGVGRIDPQGFFGLSADAVTPRALGFGTELPLYTGGRVGAAISQARAGEAAAQAGTAMSTLSLRIDVVRTYAEAVAARDTAAAYARMETMLTEALRQARLKYETGAGTSTDMALAEARLAEAQAARAMAEGEQAAAHAALRSLSGLDVVLDERLPVPPLPDLSMQAAVERARANNPGIAAARAMVDVARGGLSGARAGRLPTLGAYAEAASVRDQFFPGYRADSASVGVRARWTLFDGGRAGSKVRAAEAELAERTAQLGAAEQEIERRTAAAYAALIGADRALTAARARRQASDAALRGVRLEVQAGALPMLALLDAERDAAAAAAEETRALARRLVQAEALAALLGGT
ncbi:TolC family protein [Sphingomonas sp.]|uniref:TolC family protein n=1 Tax=Sphingomonas sp. TaxID=28214 RepID=UPI0018050841|nr:TolC family protein [Sphingomonas sp.]MBA4762067.1 TolC family protein [Sphingomonas sp.]